ncbi:MAG: MlaD family protein [Opitutales bacterium]
MRRKGNPALVGTFVVSAIALLIGFTVFTGGFAGWRGENERFVLTFQENIYGLHKGSKVTLNGVHIGRVERFFLGQAADKSPMPVLVEIDRNLVDQHMISDPNGLFDEVGRFNEDKLHLMRARLETESYVTGILYVNLEYDSNGTSSQLGNLHGYPEIATKTSKIKEFTDSLDPQHLGMQINKLLETANDRLEDLDVAVIRDSFETIAKDFTRFIDTFSERFAPLGPNIAATSEQARITLEKLSKLVDNLQTTFSRSSDLRFEIDDTLRQVSATMKALRALAEYLERNPSALLRGKGGSGGGK